MIIYGRNAVTEVLRKPFRVQQIWATKNTQQLVTGNDVPVHEVSAEVVQERCGSRDHQGVCAEIRAYEYADAADLLSGPNPLIVALDGIQDPQNLGAICRTAEVAGATGLVIPRHRSATITPAVYKASAGAVEHLAIAEVRNLVDFLKLAKAHECWCYGAAGDAAMHYLAPDYRGGVVIVMGAEGSGLRPGVVKACDALVAVPQNGQIDSLNVSAAAAVLLYGVLAKRTSFKSA